MKKFDPVGFTFAQESNYHYVHQGYFPKVQCMVGLIGRALVFQLFKVLGLKSANETDRGFVMVRVLFNFQSFLTHASARNSSAIDLPSQVLESVEQATSKIYESSAILILQQS